MDNEKQVPSMEVIAAPPAGRRPDGTFAPGNTLATPQGYKHAFTKRLSEQLGKLIDEGGPGANPLCAAHAIMMDGNEKTIHRLYAAKMLLRVIFPQAISLSMDQENPEELAIEATKVTQTLKAYFGGGMHDKSGG